MMTNDVYRFLLMELITVISIVIFNLVLNHCNLLQYVITRYSLVITHCDIFTIITVLE